MSQPIPMSVVATRREIALEVVCVCPPIPDRRFDYAAYDDATYCGCGECHCPTGEGPTRQAAIADLLEQLEAR
jgi:hypothetical protein